MVTTRERTENVHDEDLKASQLEPPHYGPANVVGDTKVVNTLHTTLVVVDVDWVQY